MFTLSRDLLLLLVRGAKTPAGHDLVMELGSGQSAHSGWVNSEQLFAVWKTLEQRSGDANLGLHLGELKGALPVSNVVFAAMLASPTVGSALERLCRYHAVVADLVQPVLTVAGKVAALTWRGPSVLHRQQAECIVSLAASILRQFAAHPLALRVTLTHPRPSDVREHLRILGHNLEFGAAQLAIFFPSELLALPVAPHSAELLGVLDAHAEQLLTRGRQAQSLATQVARQMSLAMLDGQPTLARIARSMGMGSRALQSKLRDEQTGFQKIGDQVRLDKAARLLAAGELQISEIAFLLGYSDQSAFNHAFKRWTGCSPQSFRATAQGAVVRAATQS